MKTRFVLFLAIAILAAACDQPKAKRELNKAEANTQAIPTDTIATLPTDNVITIAAVGDIMLGSSYPDSTFLPPDSAKASFKYALKDLQKADITFGNLEGVLLDTGAPVGYKLRFQHKGYLFRMPVKFGSIIKNAGFDILSVGNNHSNDFDRAGRRSTIKALDSLGIHTAGFKSHPSKSFIKNGIKYGFCAFSPNGQTVSLLQIANAKAIIRDLKANNDIVIVSFHGGGEGTDYEHVPDSAEIFKGENRGNLRLFTHAAIDAGADVVLGHGPHVARAMELYKNRLIAYSLGNFVTYKGVSVSGVCGLAPLLNIHINQKGEFLNGHIASYRQNHQLGLTPDSLNRAAIRIKALTEADFIRPGLTISSTGEIIPTVAN
ncbi:MULTISPECIES: CapA family protein [unclassified Mucilaginibacter]|uniref:CapA family protein n=1 Tax=unclassified Mucilaginibacter TaxID=2617802 RepID=UPI002AC8D857|nr:MULTISPECIES: CapA family protein [unclassified Mucilaginibacter]MEB0260432.1 CapA family protein [Mucilaginibacter sp. 10I4]MEB0280013.1 CapA family protein [Mucilaginibacter sp. 10B2]MEB0301349.1 CapA family protein [Mucilaginibacter sp. 5C4]WPX23645.1 CapA family protein [Mucilaginibacter sp. 5C4]